MIVYLAVFDFIMLLIGCFLLGWLVGAVIGRFTGAN